MLSVNRIAAKKYLACVSHFSPPEINPVKAWILASVWVPSLAQCVLSEQDDGPAELLPGHCSCKDLAGCCASSALRQGQGRKRDLSLPSQTRERRDEPWFPHTTSISISPRCQELCGTWSPALYIPGNCSAQQAVSIARGSSVQVRFIPSVQSIGPKCTGEDEVPSSPFLL